MKRYKMTKTVKGSQDGVRVELFQEGKEYELTDDLAKCFEEMGAVKPSVARQVQAKIHPKAAKMTGPTENK